MNRLPLIVHARAVRDVEAILSTLEETSARLAGKFALELRETLERIEFSPRAYTIVRGSARALRLARFKYVVFYVVRDHFIEVVAVKHGAQHPQTWLSRLDD